MRTDCNQGYSRACHLLAVITAAVVLLAGFPATACIIGADEQDNMCRCYDRCAFSCHGPYPFGEKLLSLIITYMQGPPGLWLLNVLLLAGFYAATVKSLGWKKRLLTALLVWLSGAALIIGAYYIGSFFIPQPLALPVYLALTIYPSLFVILLWLWRKRVTWWKAVLYIIAGLAFFAVPSLMMGMDSSLMRDCFLVM